MDEEVEASPVAKRMPWPIGLHSIEEKRKSVSGRRSNSCRRGSNSRSRKEKERRGGGNKGTSSRSCWSRTDSRSCGSSRGSNG